MSKRWFAFWCAALGMAASAQAQVPSISCALNSGTPPVLRSGVRTELIADLVLVCTGGTPTATGQTAPQTNINLFLNVNVTSRLLAGENWSEALLLLDEPAPGAQFPCESPSGVCSAFGNGTGTNYYGGGTQSPTSPNNRNVFQGQVVAANQIRWTGIPLDRPGGGRNRILRITNVRVDTAIGPNSLVPSTIQAFVTNSSEIPIANQTAIVGFVQDGLTPSVRTASGEAAPNGVPVPLAPAANTVRFATLRFAEAFASSAKTRTAAAFVNNNTSPPPANQNIPGNIYGSETGFFNSGFGTVSGRGNLGLAGLADTGTRLRAVIGNIPAGVSVFVDTVNIGAATGPVARLINVDANGAGGFSPAQGTNNLAQLSVVGGSAVAVWEVLRANSATAENFDFGVYLSYSANFASTPPSAVTAQMGLAPLSTVGSASATAPIPRTLVPGNTQTLFTFITAASLTAVPQALSFTSSVGGTPPPQTVLIGSTGGQTGFTVTTSGQIPLSIQPPSGTTPANVLVSPAPQTLPQGTYEGAITVSSPSAISVVIPVVLRVTPAPVINSLNPAAAVSGGPTFPLTVNGSNFAVGSTVRWNSVPLATTFQSAGQLIAQVPASLIEAPGTASISVTLPDGSTSNAVAFPVTRFSITSINPSSVSAGTPAFTLTISGSGFESGATVQAGRVTLTPLSVSAGQITVTVPATLVVQPGNLPVTVTNPSSLVSNAVTLTVVTGPVISSLSPGTVSAGGSGFALTINGSGFQTGATVQLRGSTVQPTSVSATQVVVPVPGNQVAQAGTLPVTVANPNGAVSNTVSLTIAAAPVITSLSPASAIAGGPAFTLTITGTGFVAGATVQIGGTTLQPSAISATSIGVSVPAARIAEPGTLNVTVTNPGNVVSNAIPLTVGAPPVITSLNPAAATPGGPAFTLTITGTGFAAGFTALWNGQSLNSVVNSATQITAQVPAALIAAPGSASITVAGGGVSSRPATFLIAVRPVITRLSSTSFALGSGNTALVITGTGFGDGSQVAVSIGSAGPTLLTPGSVTPTEIGVTLPADLFARSGTGSVMVANPGGLVSNAVPITIALPALPQPSFTGPAASPSGEDQTITVGLTASYPAEVQGTLTLTFAPDGTLPNDPAIQFQNNSRTFNFTLPAGSTTRPQVTVKTGTVAGVITITPSFTADGVNVTPPAVTTQRIQIARAAPVLSFVDCIRTSNSTINVIVDGHTNTREATDALFTFQAAAGANLGTSQLTVPAATLFSSWFGGTASANAGGTFRYTQTFNVQGSAADVGSISVRLSNSIGPSAVQGAASCRVQ